MAERTYQDPYLELATRLGGDATDVIDLASDGLTEEEAEIVISTLDEVEAEMAARDITDTLRQMGHTL